MHQCYVVSDCSSEVQCTFLIFSTAQCKTVQSGGGGSQFVWTQNFKKVGVCKPWSLLPLVVLGIVPQRTSGTKTWALTCDVFKVRKCVHNHKTWKKIEKHLQFEHNNLHVLHSIVWVWWEYFQPDRVIRVLYPLPYTVSILPKSLPQKYTNKSSKLHIKNNKYTENNK
jgi:hypothetical protein